MCYETTKSNKLRRKAMPLYQKIFQGSVLDIGCGPDPISPTDFPKITSVKGFDLEDGDANRIDEYSLGQFDVVYGSQVLEHLVNPHDAVRRFLNITKPGGHVVMSVPEFARYEHHQFPSINNPDHKTVWGIKRPDHPRGVGIYDMLAAIPNIEILLIMVCDTNYDYTLDPSIDQTFSVDGAEAWLEFAIQKLR